MRFAHDPQIRRLRAMQREVAVMLVVNIIAIAFPHPITVLVISCANALLWGLMLQEVRRDLASATSPLSHKQGDRMRLG